MIKSDYIRGKLSYIKSIVEDDTKQKLYNINTTAEYIFMQVLNDVYNLSLINANDEKANFPAIDLIDTTNEIVFQVTAEISTTKVRKETIEKFNELVKQDEYKKYVNYKIKMFYIKEKPNFSDKIVEEFSNKGVPKSHLLGIEDINREVMGDPDVAQKVFETLRKIFHDVDNSAVPNPNFTLKSSTYDSSFVGREDEIKAIDEMLNKSNSLLLINGIGGIGKSSLANHYLYIREKEFDYYGFIEGLSSFVSEFRNSLDLKSEKEDELHREIISKLQGLKGKKLLVIDNVEDIEDNRELIEMILSLVKYDYKILFTSRRKIKKVKSYPLGTLLPMDAKNLFLSYYKTDEIEKVDKIIEYLGLHTLFIKLVAETIENEGYSLDDILKKFENGELSKIKFIDEESGDELTFNYNLQELFSMQNLKNEYVLLLKRLAVLPSIDIELNFLEEILGSEQLKGRLNFLVGRGWLIESEGSYKLHQIIKEFLLFNHAPCFEEIGDISDNLFTSIENSSDIQVAMKNRNNIIYFNSLINIFDRLEMTNEKIATYSLDLGNIYSLLEIYEKVESLYLQALKIREKIFGKEDLNIVTIYNSLAGFYKSMGMYDKVEYFYFQALRIYENEFEENLLNIVIIYNNLAEFYRLIHEYEKSEELYLKTLKIKEEILEEDDLSIAISANNLGELYETMGIYDKSKKFHLQALEIRERILGKEDYTTAISYSNLAILYSSMEFYYKSEKFYFKALKIWEKEFNENNTRIAKVYISLGTLYFSMKKYAKTEEFYLKGLRIFEKILGAEHPTTIIIYNNLTEFYRRMEANVKPKQNDPCPCNSGKKYKKCCGKQK